MAMLEIQNIHKSFRTYDEKPHFHIGPFPRGHARRVIRTLDVLRGVDLTVEKGDVVAILGPSGSGKTTLLNIIGGLDRYDSGDLIINGISTKKYKDRDWDFYRNNSIGFVFQSYNLIPHQTVLSNVELALTLSGVSKAERKKRAIEALEKVGLGEQIHKKPNQMSGGQMQRVAIARALAKNPKILLCDEPTGALDYNTGKSILKLLYDTCRERNVTVIVITHNLALTAMGDKVIKVKNGLISEIEINENPIPVERIEW